MYAAVWATFASCVVLMLIMGIKPGWRTIAGVANNAGGAESGVSKVAAHHNWPQALGIALICALVVGTRVGVPGTDTYTYTRSYELAPVDFSQALALKDPGYQILVVLFKWLGLRYVHLQFFLSLLTTYAYMRFIHKYSVNIWFSTALFFFVGLFAQQTNGMRQMLAAGIILLGFQHLERGHFWRFSAICLAASLLHASALFMIPAYFFLRSDPWGIRTLLIAVGALAVLAMVDRFVEATRPFWLQSSLPYAAALARLDTSFEGANPIRALVQAVPALLSLALTRKGGDDTAYGRILVNGSILNAILYLFSLYNWVFARMAFYTLPLVILLLPYLVQQIKPRPRLLLVLVICGLYAIYHYIDVSSWSYASYLLVS